MKLYNIIFVLSVMLPYGTWAGQFLDEQSVEEGAKIGLEVSNVRKLLQRPGEFTAKQLADKNTRIYFANKAESRPFEMSAMGTIRVAGQVDREQICDPRLKKRMRQSRQVCSRDMCCIVLQVQVSVAGSQTFKSHFVKVIISDVNDNAPTFPFLSAEPGGGGVITVAEDAEVGQTRLPLPVATDADSPRFGVKSYTWTDFKPPSIKNHFKLAEDEQMRPYLEVITPLDRENQAEYRFTLVAKDGGYQPRTGTTPIRIVITDVNDNKPQFDRKAYSAIIKEGQMNGLDISFDVTDEDIGKNSEITYRILDKSSRASQFFQVIPRTGGATLHLKREIDFEKDGDIFEFKVMASDRGTPPASSTADVTIRVENVNDHKPVIEFLSDGKNLGSAYAHVTVQEGQGNNQVIAQVHVSDLDSKLREIECLVIEGADHFHLEENRQVNLFIAASKQYNLRSKFAFDRELTKSYSVMIECDDKAKPVSEQSRAQLTVQVDDLNDNEPQFTRSKYFGWINENARDSLVEMREKIEAKDLDEGENAMISYSLLDHPDRTDSQSFTLSTHSPTLLSRDALDYETKKEYRFLVVAQDRGKPPLKTTSQVVIKVRDCNDNAPVLSQANYNFKVMEEEEAHKIVGRVEATDKDTDPVNREVIYSLQNYNPSQPFRATDYLSIGTYDGIIRTKQKIDREKVESLVFTVSARNKAPLVHASKVTAESIVHVTILDRNDNKPVVKSNQPHKLIEMMLEADPTAENCVPFSLEFVDNDSSEEGNGKVEVSLGDDQMTRQFTLRENNRLLCINRRRLSDGSLGDPLPVQSGTYFITVLARDMPNNGTAQETKEKVMVQVKQRPPDLLREIPRITGDRRGQNSDSRNVTIIAVLASIAGLFCLILLVIIFVFKKCAPMPEKDECSDKYDVSCPENAATLNRGHGTLDYRTTSINRPETCGLLGSRLADMELDACEDGTPGHTTLRYETQWRTPKAARRCPSEEPTKKLSKSCESLEGPGGGRQLFNALEDAQNGYQVLDPVLTLKSRNSLSGGGGGGISPEQNVVKERNSGGYQDLNEQTLGGKKNNNYYDCVTEAEAMYSPRRSLKNAYFQTSFV